jgi:hypothetical protein
VSSARRVAAAVGVGLATVALAAGCGSDTEAPDQVDASLPLTSTPTTDATVPLATETSTTPSAAERAARRAQRARAQQRKRRAAARRRAAAAEARTEAETTPAAPDSGATPAETPTPEQSEQPAPTPEPQPKPKPTGPPTHTITEQATMQLVSKNGLRSFVHEGGVEGTLTGTMNLRTRLGGPGIIGDFTVTLSDGTMRGRATGTLSPSGSKATFKGTAAILGGTGAYAQANGTGLAFSGHVSSDASRSFIRMSGQVRY